LPSKNPFVLDRLELPKSEIGEKGLLCSIIQNTAILVEEEKLITDLLFQIPANRLILKKLRELAPTFKAIDFITLLGSFSPLELTEIGEKEYLNEVFSCIDTAANWRYYFDQAYEAYRLRTATYMPLTFSAWRMLRLQLMHFNAH
jgi:replicative DNA helicase